MFDKIVDRANVLSRDLFVNSIASSPLCLKSIRCIIYKMYGLNINSRGISPKCFMGNNKITIGKNTFINYGCFFENSTTIDIGDNCAIGMEVMFCNSTHKIGDSNGRAGQRVIKPIKVGDGCWIGTRAIILPDVIIGDGCVIAAGAVVNKDCEPNGLYAGVPARRIKDLPVNNEEKRES